ncbi:alpha/beta hydrolase fold domain-containing protein [Nocardia rhizosphaerihabitans]|uniref:Esterase n=1 Tax=Nocardia rhizosphaerihabitans TaxID=1691570 RepID=A0ABQ2KSE8_9NOCA|nr:alpha/beta hydrolase fold domain-containing protein [Nocardia rhizosphaerihabitans]GGN90236.1 esterase [Nocardia rhizosphaerihabitans]
MPSVMSRVVVPAYLRITRANRNYVSAEAAREHVRRLSAAPLHYAPPRRLRGVVVSKSEDRGWPVYTLTPVSGPSRGGLVYAHGGGWVGEIAPQHWHLAARLAAQLRLTVTVPIYPLIPFGTAAQVIPRFAEIVTDSHARYGPTFVAGDSAGGQIALSTALRLRDTAGTTVPRTVLISPALDLTLENPLIAEVLPRDPWLGREGGLVFGEMWSGDLPMKDPIVSPLFGDFTGLGPLTVFTGTEDILNPDAHLLLGKARAAGVDIDFHEGHGLVHVYPLTPSREGQQARRHIVETLRADLSRAGG